MQYMNNSTPIFNTIYSCSYQVVYVKKWFTDSEVFSKKKKLLNFHDLEFWSEQQLLKIV